MEKVDELRAKLAADADDHAAYHELARTLTAAGRDRECADLVERWAERRADSIESAREFAAAAGIRERLGDLEKARKLYARALELDPRQVDAALAFSKVSGELREVHRHIETLEAWAAKLATVGTSAERANAEIALARAWSLLPGRLDKSMAHYRAAIALDPELEAVLEEAVDKARKARRMQEVRSLIVLAAESARSPERKAELYTQLADAQREPPTDPDGTVESLRAATRALPDDRKLAEALVAAIEALVVRHRGSKREADDRRAAADGLTELARISPESEALPYLARALELDAAHDEALAMLEDLAPRVGDEDALVRRLEVRVASGAEDPNAAAHRTKLATLLAKKGRHSEAFDVLEPLLGERPPHALASLAIGIARDAGRYLDAIHLVAAAVESPEGRKDTLRGLLRRASKAGDVSALAEGARLLLALVPDDDEALAALMDFHAKRNEPTGTRAWLERRIAAAKEPAIKRDLLRGLVALADGPLADPVVATDAFQKLAELDPRDHEVRRELVERLEKTGRLRALASVRAWEATHLETKDERKHAIDALRTLNASSPVDSALLLSTLRAYRTTDPGDGDVRRWLIEVGRDVGELDEVVLLLREEIRAARDDSQRLAALSTLAELLERSLRDDEAARIASLHVLDLDPMAIAEVERIERIAARGRDRSRIIEACERRAAATVGDEQLEVLLRLASLYEDEAGDLHASIRVWESIRAIDPSRIDAAESLLRLYGTTHRHADSIALLDEIAGATTDSEIRIAALRERARISRHELDDAEAAADCYRAIRAIREDDEAFEALVDHARATERDDELAELLAARLATSTDRAELIELGTERGLLFLDRLADADEAERELLRVIELDPRNDEVLEALARLYEQTENAPRLAEITAARLAIVVDPAAKAELARRLVILHERVVIDPKKALEANRAWALAAPMDLDALRGLAERLDETDDADELVRVLDTRANELVRTLERTAPDDRPALVALRDEAFDALLASARVATAADPAAASHAEERLLTALEVVNESANDVAAAVRVAVELDGRLGGDRLRRAVATFLARRATIAPRPTKDALFLAAADAFGTYLDDAPRAFEVLTRAIEECPDDDEIRRSLVDYATTSGLESELDRVLEARYEASIDAATSRALLRERANLLYTMGKYDVAADQYQRLSAMDPTDDRARTRHRECLVRAERYQDLLIALEQAIRRIPMDEVARRVSLMREVARTWDGPLANRMEALDAWRRVAMLVPNDPEAREAMERLAPKRRVAVDETPLGVALEGSSIASSPPKVSMPPPVPSARPSVPPPVPEGARDESEGEP